MTNEWSGSQWRKAPDEFWVDDNTGELVCNKTALRLCAPAYRWTVKQAQDAVLVGVDTKLLLRKSRPAVE